MVGLIITIVISILLSVTAVIIASKTAKTDKAKRIWIIAAACGTVLIHYSSIIYHAIGHAVAPDQISTVLNFVECNPNLVLPIYPCNVVMWLCLILAFLPKKDTKTYRFLVDFCFVFGVVSAFVGICANGDYFNPNVVKDYDVCKSAVAHACMMTNVLLLPVFGYFKLDTIRNTINVAVGVALMAVIGLIDDAIIAVIGSVERMQSYNAMFLFRSPIDGVSFLTFYILGPVFIVATFGILTLIETIKLPKEERWYNKIARKNKN